MAILFNVVWEEETMLPLWPQREGPALSSVGGIVSSPHNIKEGPREGCSSFGHRNTTFRARFRTSSSTWHPQRWSSFWRSFFQS